MGMTALKLQERLLTGELLQDAEVSAWVASSERMNAAEFYAGEPNSVYCAVQDSSKRIVKDYLNHPNPEDVPLRLRTKFCLILNNFALHPPVRQAVFNCLDGLSKTFEKAIADEGAMEFDQELGRMSEHVLVLLMRVMNYKLTASAVHEFAEKNVQFSIQLLLAILLKEPAYENELRFNCISDLLGFSQPQAFFTAGQRRIEEHDCTAFTEKVTFMMELMLRLQAIQVISEVLSDCIVNVEDPTVCLAITNTMKMIMNIFKFGSNGEDFSPLQWRQHILLSTSFMDGTVLMFIQGLSATLETALRSNTPVAPHLIPSLSLAFKFGAFATYHLGSSALELRILCTFFSDSFYIPIRPLLTDPAKQAKTMDMYVNLLHFMCNVDAFAGENEICTESLLPELFSSALRRTLDRFFRGTLSSFGLATVQAWHKHFLRTDTNIMVSYDSTTYQTLDALFTSVEEELKKLGNAPPPAPDPAPSSSKGGLLSDLPLLKNMASKDVKVSIDAAAKPAKKKEKTGKTSRVVDATNNTCFCALTGNVMKNPVTSPYGHTFEKEDILRWLEENGSICPITGKSLTPEQLKPNAAVASLVMQRVVKESMTAQGDDDLYNF